MTFPTQIRTVVEAMHASPLHEREGRPKGWSLRWVFCVVFSLALTGCSLTHGAGNCDEAGFERQLGALRAAVEAEIGGAEATDVAACRTLPFGDKPCGGPWTFLVYSTEASDSTRLAELAAEYDRADAERNRACELVSDCAMVVPPEVALVDGRCVAAP